MSSKLNGYRMTVMPTLYNVQAIFGGCHATTPVPKYIAACNKIQFAVTSDCSAEVTEDKITVTNASKSFSNGVVTIYNPTGDVTINILLRYSTVDLNNGQWVDSGTTVEGHKVYQSTNHSDNSEYYCTITINGFTEFIIYIRSDAESNYDYTKAFALDSTSSTKYTTQGRQNSYYAVTYSNIDEETHTIRVSYRKDGSASVSPDIGSFYIAST